jgi:hypothetical protein
MQDVDGLNRILPEPGPVDRIEQSKRREQGQKETPFPARERTGKKRKRFHVLSKHTVEEKRDQVSPGDESDRDEDTIGGTVDRRA